MKQLFTKDTTSIFSGLQPKALQSMLDFDYLCGRKPSVVAIINPAETGIHKAFFGSKGLLIPVYCNAKEATKAHQKADVLVNLCSMRSAYQATIEALECPSIRVIAVIAEGVPERHTRKLTALARKKHVAIIGPATVGGLSAGNFRIGNTGGTVQNLIESRLFRPGSVGLVTKSGGLANEKFRVISENSDGIAEGIAIGGDRD